MKQFKTLTGNILSLAAIVYLALIPAFHSLHLATCGHEQTGCSGHHQHNSIRQISLSGAEMPPGDGADDPFSATDSSPVITGTGHEASSCPVCQSLFRLLRIWWLIGYLFNSIPGWNSVSHTCPDYHQNPDWILLSPSLSRAPPSSC